MPAYLCTQQDVISRFGGQVALSQCLDPDQTGSIDTATLDLARADASNTVLTKAGNRFGIGLDATPDNCPPYLRMLAAKLSVCESWVIGTKGQGVPPNIVQLRMDVMTELTRIEDGKGGVGQPTPADRITRGPFDLTRNGQVRRVTIGRTRGVMF